MISANTLLQQMPKNVWYWDVEKRQKIKSYWFNLIRQKYIIFNILLM